MAVNSPEEEEVHREGTSASMERSRRERKLEQGEEEVKWDMPWRREFIAVASLEDRECCRRKKDNGCQRISQTERRLSDARRRREAIARKRFSPDTHAVIALSKENFSLGNESSCMYPFALSAHTVLGAILGSSHCTSSDKNHAYK